MIITAPAADVLSLRLPFYASLAAAFCTIAIRFHVFESRAHVITAFPPESKRRFDAPATNNQRSGIEQPTGCMACGLLFHAD